MDFSFVQEHLLGPQGGLVALAYMAGAASSFSLMHRTLLREAKNREREMKEDLEGRIGELKERIRYLEDRLEKQLAESVAKIANSYDDRETLLRELIDASRRSGS